LQNEQIRNTAGAIAPASVS